MEWRTVLGAVSGAGLIVGTVASVALIHWMRFFFATLAIALAGVAGVGALVVWDRSASPRLLATALGLAVLGAVLLWWGRATDPGPHPRGS